ncbi:MULTISPECIES: hypothetical protein [Halorussus]|uniref:hypothetical protein n=1 Tax=Halorussus TaxID=1070314 RepID=UPI000E215401|nr:MULTISPECIES: hypothetical protein [Halorussus]NHN61438.1 hypothetical protein [Halorussus sp. JP-T4]
MTGWERDVGTAFAVLVVLSMAAPTGAVLADVAQQPQQRTADAVRSQSTAAVSGATGPDPTVAAGRQAQNNSTTADGPATAGGAPPGSKDANATETVYHVDPDEVGDGDASDVSGYLAREMAEQLSSSLNASQGEIDRARRLVGNDSEYADLANKYREVTGDSSAEDAGPAFTRVGLVQRSFLANVTRYRQTLDTYRTARNGSNATRERVLAHRLADAARDVNRSADRLNRSYRNAAAERDIDLESATASVGDIRTNITRSQREVRGQSLVRTDLRLRPTDGVASFTDPVTLAGRLRTADGSAVASEALRFRVGNQTLNATTDRRGRFEVSYRPTLIPPGERRLVVRYRPGNTSRYAGATAGVRVNVTRVTPDVTITNRTQAVGYGEDVVVNGTVGADGVGAAGVPVVVSVAGAPLNRTTTGPNGSFGVAEALPANVTAGDRRVSVRVPAGNRALAGASAAADLTVEPSDSSLRVTNSTTFGKSVFVSGYLRTSGGAPLPNQTVVLHVDGKPVARALTNATGGYATTANVSSELAAGESLRVNLTYGAVGTNLRPSRTSATVRVPAGGGSMVDSPLLVGAAGALGIAVLGVFAWRFRADDSAGGPGTTDEGEVHPVANPGRSAEGLFGAADDALDAGEFDAAVLAAYGGVRRRLATEVESSPADTHWEFLDDCRAADLPDDRIRRLEALTERVDRAAFASESVDPDEARAAVETASAFRGEAERPAATADD